MSNRLKYCFIGILFGLFFPVIASIFKCYEEQLILNSENILLIQKSTPLIWLIDTAPLFLGIFAAFAGKQMDILSLTNEQLEERYLEKIKTEKELSKKNEELEEAKRLSLVGEFAAGIAHEVNNPLAVIHSKVQLLELQLNQLTSGKADSVEKVTDSLETIKQMTIHM